MKSPLKYPKYPIYMFGIGGLVLTIFLLAIAIRPGESIGILRILSSVALDVLFVLMGWAVAFTSGTIFNRKVDNQVEPEELVEGHIYWLNGETPARFMGKSNYTGKFHFHIDGLDDPNDDEDSTSIIPGLVHGYISPVQEVFPPLNP